MDITELIYRLIPLLLFFIIMMNPLLKKLIKKKLGESTKQKEKSVKSLIVEKNEPTVPVSQPIQPTAFSPSPPPVAGKVEPSLYQTTMAQEKTASAIEKLEKLPDLKKAVIWSEILSKPVGLRD